MQRKNKFGSDCSHLLSSSIMHLGKDRVLSCKHTAAPHLNGSQPRKTQQPIPGLYEETVYYLQNGSLVSNKAITRDESTRNRLSWSRSSASSGGNCPEHKGAFCTKDQSQKKL